MNEKRGKFLQAPLCIMADGKHNFAYQMELFFAHALVNFIDKTRFEGSPTYSEMTFEKRESAIEKSQGVIGFSGGNEQAISANNERACKHVSVWVGRYGKTCSVRIRTDLIFAARDGDMTEREARVLFGLYSAIGDKPYVKATWQAIQHRAAGWVRPFEENVKDDYRGPIYSRHQIDRTLIELMDRGLVSGATYNRGERYWSHSLDEDGLWKQIATRKLNQQLRGSGYHQHNAERSKALMEMLEKAAPPVPAKP